MVSRLAFPVCLAVFLGLASCATMAPRPPSPSLARRPDQLSPFPPQARAGGFCAPPEDLESSEEADPAARSEPRALLAAATGKVPNYDAFSNPDGTLKDGAAAFTMLQDPDQVDQLYTDAAAGNARAKRAISDIEGTYRESGKYVADATNSPECLLPVVHELKGVFGGPACIPNWSAIDYLSRDRPGGVRLREVLAEAYSQQARQLRIRNEIIINGLNVVLAGWATRAALAAEARALAVEATPRAGLPPPRDFVTIPAELRELKGASVAERLGLPAPPEGYVWAKTPVDGQLVVKRAPGRGADLPQRRYDPATRTFPKDSASATPKPEVAKAMAVAPGDLEAAGKQAQAAKEAIGDVPARKTGAARAGGTKEVSGWGSDVRSLDPVKDLSRKIGHTPDPNPALDARGCPGSYNLSHAEKKVATAKPGQPIGVSEVMCLDCQRFFQKLANHLGKPVVVADPAGIRAFLPDGRVLQAKTATALGAQLAIGADSASAPPPTAPKRTQ